MMRVECRQCGAHRDLDLAPRCLVCGAECVARVVPTAGDVDAITREVLASAEAIDVALHRGTVVTDAHPIAVRLAQACRHRALALAGVLAP